MSDLLPGVIVQPLRVIPDERGWLMEVLRNDDPSFTQFGQVYVSATYPGVVKAWHYHTQQTDTFACMAGMVKLVLMEPKTFAVNEFYLGPLNPVRVTIPPGLYHGWKCISLEPSLVVNVPDKPYDYAQPDEHRIKAHGCLPYSWTRKDG